MLRDRASQEPTVADVEVILAELDPPEAYGTATSDTSTTHTAGKTDSTESRHGDDAKQATSERRVLSIVSLVLAIAGPMLIFFWFFQDALIKAAYPNTRLAIGPFLCPTAACELGH